jgi:hypothetical protein
MTDKVTRFAQLSVRREAVVAWMPAAAIVALALAAAVAPVTEAASCPNEEVRNQEVLALKLPDCRAYEQVSPVDKGLADALGAYTQVQAAPAGEGGIVYFSISPFPGVPGAGELVTYLSSRSSGAWSTQGLLPPSDPANVQGSFQDVMALTSDLEYTIVFARAPLAPGGAPETENYYVYDNKTKTYRFLAAGIGTLNFLDASKDDSSILFEYTEAQLLPEAAPGVGNLYEWDGSTGSLRLVSVLPASEGGGAPVSGAFAGAGPAALGGGFYTEHTISDDGTRIFWTDAGSHRIYVREDGNTTMAVSAGSAEFLAATPGGSSVFYQEAGGLQRVRIGTAGTPETPESLAASGAEVEGLLGISDDGAYAYIVAKGVLAGNSNSHGEAAGSGANNLYEWNDGQFTFVARLVETGEGDAADWANHTRFTNKEPKRSRVTPDGQAVLFTSYAALTGYDNVPATGGCEGASPGTPCGEVFLYSAGSKHLTCVSCNPLAPNETSEALLNPDRLSPEINTTIPSERNAFLTHNLSDNGDRVFFSTKEGLVPQDNNHKLDVYEWERTGAFGCQESTAAFSPLVEGCLYLISTGRSTTESKFGDADAEGSNVYFFTVDSLVGEDQDGAIDVYDAREDGGLVAQNPPSPAAPCAGEGCRGGAGGEPPPAPPMPASATFSGPGNRAQTSGKSSAVVPSAAVLRARKLARALKACRSKPKRQRASCAAAAQRRYGSRSRVGKVAHSRGSHRNAQGQGS